MRAGLARIMVNAAVGLMGVALGLGGSVAGAINVATGARRHRVRQLRWARTYAMIVGFGAVLAVVAMERALITRDFHLAYVAQVGSSRTPALFNFAAMWSALEGSISFGEDNDALKPVYVQEVRDGKWVLLETHPAPN